MAMGDNVRSRNRIDYNDQRGQNIYGNANAYLGAQGQQFQGDYNRALGSDEQMRNAAMGGFQNFMQSGGLSAGDANALRARAVSPIRSAYAGAKRDVNRLNMGAGKATMLGRLAREGGQSMSDATTNAEASLAGMRQQGRLQGAQGMLGLYGTAPGMTGLQSRNVLENTNQGLNLLGNEYNRMQGIMGAQNQASQLPGMGQTMLNNALNVAQTVQGMWPKK